MVIRVVFLGTPQFAVPTLTALLDSPEIEVQAVITQPDRRAGRGRKLFPPPVKVLARNQGVPVFQFPSIRKSPEAFSLINRFNPDAGVVVAFGQILPAGFFDRPPLGTLNVHASLLPAYRGAAPIIHSLINGEEETGVTIMKIDEGMDTGPVLNREKISVPEEMTAGELEAILSEQGAALLVNTLIRYASGEIQPVEQDHNRATYAPRIGRKTARIRWEDQARAVHNRIRAMNPRPGAWSLFRGLEVKIWRSGLFPGASTAELPGTIVQVRDGLIEVACGGGTTLGLVELQMPGRKKVSASEFVNGNRLKRGERFRTPPENSED